MRLSDALPAMRFRGAAPAPRGRVHRRRAPGALSLAVLSVLAWCSPSASQSMAIEPHFGMAGTFHRGVAPASEGTLWGLIDARGEWVVPPSFQAIGPGGDGLFPFREGGRWGFVDGSGSVRIKAVYEEAQPFREGMAPVRRDGSWGLLREDGSVAVDFRFGEIGGYEGSIVSARDDEGWAVFTAPGTDEEVRDDLSYAIADELEDAAPGEGGSEDAVVLDRLYSVSEGAVVAAARGREFLVDFDRGWPSASPPFHSVRRRSEGLAAVAPEEGRWGYLDENGDPVWEGRFEDALAFENGLAPVRQGGLWGYVDKTGAFLVEPRYDAAFPFRDGYAVVRRGDRRGFLRYGDDGIVELIPPVFDDASRFSEGLAAVKIDGAWGYVRDDAAVALRQEPVVELRPE